MATDTVVKDLILNKMTKEQYDNLATKDANQLYFLLDGQSEPGNPTSFYNQATTLAGKNFLIFTVPGAVTSKSVTSDLAYFYNTSPMELLLTVCTDSPSSSSSELELKVVFNRSGAKVISEYATGIFEDAIYALYYNENNHYSPAFVVSLTHTLAEGGDPWAVISSFYGGHGFGWAPSAYFANVVDAGQFTFIEDVPVVKSSVGTDNNGIKGDYCATWGWMESSTRGLPTIVSDSNNITIPAGTILMCPGSDGYITISSDTTFENNLTGDFTLFYARNLDGTGAGFIAATEVVWSDTEPEPNGQTGFQAWKKSGSSNWQLRSNDSGNVWREVVGGPIADIHYTDGNATRIDFDGYRQFNKQWYATIPELNARVPSPPFLSPGNYVLKATVAELGSVTTQWVKET